MIGKKYFNVKERIINPLVWIILMYWLISLWVGELSATIPWGFVLETRRVSNGLKFTYPFKHYWIHFYGYGDRYIVVFLCPIPPKLPLSHIYYWVWWFSQKENQMNNILLQIMEWLIYHSIEIILLILCVVGWKLWWEISWEMRRWIP